MSENPVLAALNHPFIRRVLFHPRPDEETPPLHPAAYKDIQGPEGLRLSGEIHACGIPDAPLLLFFHGNGEIASDYRDIAPLFTALGWDFLVMDYRGYGRSEGEPTAANLQEDALYIFDTLRDEAPDRPMALMGRSLGSAAALYIASRRPEAFRALIIESGFADTRPLIRLLGADPEMLGISKDADFGNLTGIRSYQGPTLILHGENDHVIPLAQAEKLKQNAAGKPFSMVVIPIADHNSLLYYGIKTYFSALATVLGEALHARL